MRKKDNLRHILHTLIVGGVFTFVLVFVRVEVSLGQQPSHYFVDPDGSNTDNDGLSPDTPFATIQHALDAAQPGDTIHLAPATFAEDVVTVRDGKEGAPITITGTPESIVVGAGNNRIFQVHHSFIVVEGFTIDGRTSDSNKSQATLQSKLLYVVGQVPDQPIRGLRVINMHFRNAGEECLRIRYYVQQSEIAYSTFEGCGLYDFQMEDEGKVGEAIYVGTSSSQWGRNPTHGPDETAFNWIHHNQIETHGNECIELKEGTHDNIVEHNLCTQQQDPESGGIVSRGNRNIIRYNEIYENAGAGIRLGGHNVNGTQYGVDNHVYGNIIYNNRQGGIKLEAAQQGLICGNTVRDNEGGMTTGEFAGEIDPQTVCDTAAIQQQPVRPF